MSDPFLRPLPLPCSPREEEPESSPVGETMEGLLGGVDAVTAEGILDAEALGHQHKAAAVRGRRLRRERRSLEADIAKRLAALHARAPGLPCSDAIKQVHLELVNARTLEEKSDKVREVVRLRHLRW